MAELITNNLGNEEWLINLNLLSEINAWKDDKAFIRSFLKVRYENKKRLIEYLFSKSEKIKTQISDFTAGFLSSNGNEDIMIDVMAKRISSSKRQILYLFYILLKYIRLKESAKGSTPLTPANEGKILFIVSGRAPHSSFEGKKVIEAIYKVMKIVNEDPQTKDHLRLIFVPNFNVALCEQLVAAADLS